MTPTNKTQEVDNSLEIIQPQGKYITIKRDNKIYEFNVTEYMFGDLSEVAKLISAFSLDFADLTKEDAPKAIAIILSNSDVAYRLIQISLNSQLDQQGITGVQDQLQWIKSLSGLDGVNLATAVVKINYDFFYQAKEIIMTEFPQLKTYLNGESKQEATTEQASTITNED